MLFVLPMFLASPARAQTKKEIKQTTSAPRAGNEAENKNVQAYIDFLRQDVSQQKAEIMGSILLLNASDAANSWPIYYDYESEL